MVKRVFIVHGRGTNPDKAWYRWLSEELKLHGIEAYVPKMPNSNFPKISSWINFLKKNVGSVSEETYMVGHSLGAQAVVRYISGLSENEKVGGAILVAPFQSLRYKAVRRRVEECLEDFVSSFPVSLPSMLEETLKDFFVSRSYKVTREWNSSSIDWEAARAKCRKYVCFFSTNDRYVNFNEESVVFERNLGADIKIISNGGHLGNGKGYKAFPQLLESVLSIAL